MNGLTLLQSAAILLALTATFSYFNARYIKLPPAVGVMLISLVLSLALIGLGALGFGVGDHAKALHGNLDFGQALLRGMLSFLLFAGSLHLDLSELARQKMFVAALATAGVLLSTLLIGSGTYCILRWMSLPAPFLACLLFGALISPTDPIAVMGFLKTADLPKHLSVQIAGESLFNDGVGVILFTILGRLLVQKTEAPLELAGLLFFKEAVGGAALGLLMGWAVACMIQAVDSAETEILLTLALAMGGYSLADALGASGPIATVVAGLFIGNEGRSSASKAVRSSLIGFWEILDEILNAVLFVMIGLEVFSIAPAGKYLLAAPFVILLALLARLASVAAPLAALRGARGLRPEGLKILVWGGLRGGLSVAMALSMPPIPSKELFLSLTYAVVVFSVIIQSLAVRRMIVPVQPSRS